MRNCNLNKIMFENKLQNSNSIKRCLLGIIIFNRGDELKCSIGWLRTRILCRTVIFTGQSVGASCHSQSHNIFKFLWKQIFFSLFFVFIVLDRDWPASHAKQCSQENITLAMQQEMLGPKTIQLIIPPLKQLSSREEFLVPIWSCCLHAQHRALFYHKRRALLNAIAQLLPACRGSRHQQNVARGRLTSLLHIAIKTNNHPIIPGSRPPCRPLSRHRGASEQQQQVQEQQKQQSQPSCETEQTEQPVWSQWCHKERCQRRQRDRGLSWLQWKSVLTRCSALCWQEEEGRRRGWCRRW